MALAGEAGRKPSSFLSSFFAMLMGAQIIIYSSWLAIISGSIIDLAAAEAGKPLPTVRLEEQLISPWSLQSEAADPLSVSADFNHWFDGLEAGSQRGLALEGVNGKSDSSRQERERSGSVSNHRRDSSEKNGLTGRRAVRTVAAALVVALLCVFGAREFVLRRRSPPLASLLKKPPFAPPKLNTSAQVARARARLRELRLDGGEVWRLNKFRRGQLLDETHVYVYLASLQDRVEEEAKRDSRTLPDTYIFSSWLNVLKAMEEEEPPPAALPGLPALANCQLRRCAHAKFILFPLKLPLERQPSEVSLAAEEEEEHYVLGVIDRQHQRLRIVDARMQERRDYANPLKYLKTLAVQLEAQIRRSKYHADANVQTEYRPAYAVPEPGFPGANSKDPPPERTKAWSSLSALRMLDNAASIAEGRRPHAGPGKTRELAETLWLELVMEQSREELL